MRMAKQSTKTLFDVESRMEFGVLFSSLKELGFSIASLSATVRAPFGGSLLISTKVNRQYMNNF